MAHRKTPRRPLDPPPPTGHGKHRATYNATAAGNYTLEVIDVVHGEHAVGSPFEVVVEPARPFAPSTVVWWDRQVGTRGRDDSSRPVPSRPSAWEALSAGLSAATYLLLDPEICRRRPGPPSSRRRSGSSLEACLPPSVDGDYTRADYGGGPALDLSTALLHPSIPSIDTA